MNNDNLKIHTARFQNKTARELLQAATKWGSLCERIANPPEMASKDELPLLKLAKFGDDRNGGASLRNNANVVEVHGVELDYDGGEVPLYDAALRLEAAGIEAMLYTTPRSTPDAPRWRVLAPLSVPCTPEARAGYVARLGAALGDVGIDACSDTLAQAFFYGKVTGTDYEHYRVHGKTLDQFGAVVPQSSLATSAKATGGDVQDTLTPELAAELASALSVLDADDYHSWIRNGAALHAFGDDGLELWLDWSRTSDKFDEDAAQAKWETFNDSRTGRVRTYKSIFADAQAKGWKNPKKGVAPAVVNGAAPAIAAAGGNGGSGVPPGTSVTTGGSGNAPVPAFVRSANGRPMVNLFNLRIALANPALHGYEIALDKFRGRIVARVNGEARDFTDEDGSELDTRLLTHGFNNIPENMMRRAVNLVARDNAFDSLQTWLCGLPAWDGVPRIDTFFVDYFGAEDTPYARSVGAYAWTALAGRALVPGIKADMAPILVGKQGNGKSSVIECMSPHPDMFCEVNLNSSEDTIVRLMHGKAVVELAELNGLSKRETSHVKMFMSKKVERWIPKYKEFEGAYARRSVFFGSTNEDEFLNDPTGSRRWLPLRVKQGDGEAITRDREQLWAEARVRFEASGIAWQDAERLAKDEHAEFEVSDPWEDPIAHFLSQPVPKSAATGAGTTRDLVTIRDIAVGALGFTDAAVKQAEANRIGKILRRTGWRIKTVRVSGGSAKRWVKSTTEA